jgi:hypothetical protein
MNGSHQNCTRYSEHACEQGSGLCIDVDEQPHPQIASFELRLAVKMYARQKQVLGMLESLKSSRYSPSGPGNPVNATADGTATV